MSVTYVIQARMGSSRLPGKVLMDLGGRPMLGFMLERLAGLTDGPVVVATSELERDDPIAAVARSYGAEVVRGEENDVLSRFVRALERFPAEVVVRFTADCPLIDADLARAAVALLSSHGADCSSNALIRTYPDGLDVEALTSEALHAAAAEAVPGPEREHVTPFVYRHPERFHLVNLRHDEPLGDERWTVDRLEDLLVVREIVAKLGGEANFSWTDVLNRLGTLHRPEPGALHLRPAMPRDRDRLLEWRNDPLSVVASKTNRRVEPDEHGRWYAQKLLDGGCHLLIGEIDGTEVGYARVDVTDGVGMLSLIVAPQHRGRGLASRFFVAVQDYVRSGFQIRCLEAEVARENAASKRALIKTGFKLISRGPFERLRWVAVQRE